MSSRIAASLSPMAMVVAVLALVLTGAGVGYTAGTIGTSDLENNAVTSPKVRNGTLKSADLVRQQRYVRPTLGDGGQGDCLWTDAHDELPDLIPFGFRRDRFGSVHLSGVALMDDGPGGDAACGGGGGDEVEDFTIFMLPPAARPAASLYRFDQDGSLVLIGGPDGLDLGGSTFIPPGAVLCAATAACFLDGMSFDTTGARVMAPRAEPGRPTSPRIATQLRQLLRR